LFAFCLAVVLYNALSLVTASLRRVHPQALAANQPGKKPPTFSFYYVADEIAGVWRGMEIAIAPTQWARAFAGKTPAEMARILLWLARKVSPRRFLTNPYGPQQRRKPKLMTHGGHVSTDRLLQQRLPTQASP
jgi:hypothetical protein